MVRQAVRQTHGPEQRRRTHHPEPSRRANTNDRNSKFKTVGFVQNVNKLIGMFQKLVFRIWILFVIWVLGFGILATNP